MNSIMNKLVNFLMNMNFDHLPDEAVHESKRLLLDSIGVAILSLRTEKGRCGRVIAKKYGGQKEAAILGTNDRVNCANAAFANGELINAMDYDVFAGLHNHFPPYVIPGCLAVGEATKATGKDIILSTMLGTEIATRLIKAIRGTTRLFTQEEGSEVGKIIGTKIPVYPMASALVGGAAAAGKILKLDGERMTYTLSLAGQMIPIPIPLIMTAGSRVPWTMIKLVTGWAAMAAVTSVEMAMVGYNADASILDVDHGLWRSYGSDQWEPNALTDKLGHEWEILKVIEYKPYPCFRPSHVALDCFIKIIEDNRLEPDEIKSVKIMTNPGVASSYNTNQTFENHVATQSSIPYVIAAAANRINRTMWQDRDKFHDPLLLKFMSKVTVEGHPDFEKFSLDWKKKHSNITTVEVVTGKNIFKEERQFPKGSPYAESTVMSDEELVNKFRMNVSYVLPPDKVDRAVQKLMELEKVNDFSEVIKDVTL